MFVWVGIVVTANGPGADFMGANTRTFWREDDEFVEVTVGRWYMMLNYINVSKTFWTIGTKENLFGALFPRECCHIFHLNGLSIKCFMGRGIFFSSWRASDRLSLWGRRISGFLAACSTNYFWLIRPSESLTPMICDPLANLPTPASDINRLTKTMADGGCILYAFEFTPLWNNRSDFKNKTVSSTSINPWFYLKLDECNAL